MAETLPVSARVIGRIRRMRQARRMSAQALADAVTAVGYPLSRGTLANQESGRAHAIAVDQIAATAQVFGVPIGELLEGAPCSSCNDAPPPGFTCNTCGATATTP